MQINKKIKKIGLSFSLLTASFLGSNAFAATPPANAVIGNQATASYNDSGGNLQNVSSNLVQTTIQQVYNHSLTSSQSKVAFPGGTVYFPHTLTNNGNGTDSYNLSSIDANTGTLTFTGLTIYADNNGDGVPDNTTPITNTGTLSAGSTFRFVVAALIPAGATNGATETITVGSIGNAGDISNSPALNGTNTNTVTIQTGAVMNVSKSYSIVSGPRPNTISVTLTYTNIGGTAASAFRLVDVIGATGLVGSTSYDTRDMTYGGNLSWNGSTISCAAPPVGITCNSQPVNGSTGTLDLSVSSVAPSQSGTITFNLNVLSSTIPGAERTRNVASYTDSVNTSAQATNSVSYLIAASSSVRLSDSSIGGVAPLSSTDDDGNTNNDIVRENSAAQGSVVYFESILTNTGTATDSFDLTVLSNNFPLGTTFQFFNSSNSAPMTDSNGNGIPDSGPIASNGTSSVWLRVTLPANATVDPTGWNVVISATSKNDPAATDNVTNSLNDVIERTVDLLNIVGGTDVGTGLNQLATGSPSDTQTVNPGAIVTFTLRISNTSSVSDNYDLLVRNTNTGIGNSSVNSNNLPSGWSVVFKLDGGSNNCSTTGATITNTGNILPGQSRVVCAQIQTSSGANPGNYDLFFRASSPTSANYSDNTGPDAAYDAKIDRIVINEVFNLSLTPNRNGQVFPGGSVNYAHQLCNNGNSNITNVLFPSALANNDSSASWNHSLYLDNNNDGIQDPTDTLIPLNTVISGLTLNPGQCVAILNKTFAPASATNGQVNTTNLQARGTASTTFDSNIANDVSTVITGNLALTKQQRTVSCTTGLGVAPQATYVSSTISNIAPGACMQYRVVASNIGSGSATNVQINDAVPSYTNFSTTACSVNASQTGTQAVTTTIPSNGAASGSLVSVSTTTLDPSQTLTLEFCVKVEE